jgi:hypothetical protein
VARNAFKYRPAQVAWRCDRADKFILEINEIANQQYCRVFQRAKKRKAGDAFLKIWGFNHCLVNSKRRKAKRIRQVSSRQKRSTFAGLMLTY